MTTPPQTQSETPKSLAERCYQHELASEELWTTVWEIMGGKKGKYDSPPYLETTFDPYDNSVEVILREDQAQMTREQADKILALGFGQIYESRGSEGRQWTAKSCGKCSPRTYESNHLERAILRQKLALSEASAGAMREALEEDIRWFGDLEGLSWPDDTTFGASDFIDRQVDLKDLLESSTAGTSLLQRIARLEEGALWALAQAHAYRSEVCPEDKEYLADLMSAHEKIDPQTFAALNPTTEKP